MPLILVPPYKKTAIANAIAFLASTYLAIDGNSNITSNSAFLDSSSNNFSITREGNPIQGAFTPYSPAGWSAKFNGTSDILMCASGTQTNNTLGSSNWCLEGFFTFDAVPTGGNKTLACFSAEPWGGATPYIQFTYSPASGVLFLTEANTAAGLWAVQFAFTPEVAKNYHIAVGRYNNTMFIYVDGVLKASAAFTSPHQEQMRLCLGAMYYRGGFQEFWNGTMTNVRLRIGESYSAPFAKPTAMLMPNAATRFAMLGKIGGFLDASGYNNHIVSGTATLVNSSFLGGALYDPALHGGSVYLDGATDRFTIPASPVFDMRGNFTLEGWFYPMSKPDAGNNCRLIMMGANGVASSHVPMYITSTMQVAIGVPLTGYGSVLTSADALRLNSWQHVAISVYNNGSSARIFVNGKKLGEGNITPPQASTTNAVQIGWEPTGTVNAKYKGYISGLRLSNVTDYTADFTVPSAPKTSNANTKLLMNFTNAGITDSSSHMNIRSQPAGAVVTSATQSRNGGRSVYFDGGSYLDIPNVPTMTGDFTIEAWVYPTMSSSASMANQGIVSGAANGEFVFYRSNDSTLSAGTIKVTAIPSTGYLNTHSWSHVAASRKNGVIRLFLNGVLVGSANNSAPLSFSNVMCIGSIGGSEIFKGYVDDLKITINSSLYDANFAVIPAATAYATFDPTWIANVTLSQSNLHADIGGNAVARTDKAITSGKRYWEIKLDSWNTVYAPVVGIAGVNASGYGQAKTYFWWTYGQKLIQTTPGSAYGAVPSHGDVIGVLYDAEAGTIEFFKNGVSQGVMATGIPKGMYYPTVTSAAGNSAVAATANFGQSAWLYPQNAVGAVGVFA